MPTTPLGLVSATLPPPVQPKEAGSPPTGEDWIYEFLWGGERVRAAKDEFGVRIVARDGRNLVNRFPRVAAAVAKLRAEDVVIDGEVLMLDAYPEAATRFLAQASDDISQAQVALIAYDLLRLRGKDLRETPLLGRRFLLASIVQGTPIIVSPLFHGTSVDAMAAAARLGLSGIVAKRAGSSYRPNALVTSWLKILLGPAARNRGPRGVSLPARGGRRR